MAGVVYLITNPAFQNCVKIGYATSLEEKLSQLNKNEFVPTAFVVYAWYEVDCALTDAQVRENFLRLCVQAEPITTFNDSPCDCEFISVAPEIAYDTFRAIAVLGGFVDKLHPHIEDDSGVDFLEEPEESSGRMQAFSFKLVGIPVGAELEFYKDGSEKTGVKAKVIDDKYVMCFGEKWSLSKLAQHILGGKVRQGPAYFRYKGELLTDMRKRLGV